MMPETDGAKVRPTIDCLYKSYTMRRFVPKYMTSKRDSRFFLWQKFVYLCIVFYHYRADLRLSSGGESRPYPKSVRQSMAKSLKPGQPSEIAGAGSQ